MNPQADMEPIGKWEQLVQPLRNKFILHAEMGLDIRLDPDAAKAVAAAMESMARYIDLSEAHERLTVQLVKWVAKFVLLIAVLVLLAVLA